MYAERLGSYSMCATFAGTPSLRRLKSILRYSRLAPPPRWREVLRPLTLRPPDFLSPLVRDFSGSSRVSSAKSGYVANRRPGEVGLGLRSGIRRPSSDGLGKKTGDSPANIQRNPRVARSPVGWDAGNAHSLASRVVPKIGIACPSCTWTTAFFHVRVRPEV